MKWQKGKKSRSFSDPLFPELYDAVYQISFYSKLQKQMINQYIHNFTF